MKVTKWSINEEKEVVSVTLPSKPLMIHWCPQEESQVAVMTKSGEVYLWDSFQSQDPLVGPLKFPKGICQIRWCEGDKPVLAAGHIDGSLWLWDKVVDAFANIAASEPCQGLSVTDIQWDHLSHKYVIVQYEGGFMSLFDVEDKSWVRDYTPQKNPHEMAAFMPSMPGTFVTVNSRSSVLTFWNVSQGTPIQFMKIQGKSSGGVTAIKKSSDPNKFILAFTDGCVGIWHAIQKKMTFLVQPSHAETIFDAKFKISTPNILATASFDGTLKIWDTVTNSVIGTLTDAKMGITYSVSWCPDSENEWRVCVASSNGDVMMWDVRGSGKKLSTFTHHNESVFKVHWNPLDSNLIASASVDTTCIIFNPNGKIVQTYVHPAPVYCCDWHPTNPNWIATGCHDGVVRVYDISTTSAKPIVEFRGHTARIFSIAWSPLLKDTIASCGDDRTVRVFTMNVPASKKMLLLEGHTHNVRGLCWNPEVPWLLASGSWDSTIRLWDIRALEGMRCIHVAYQHMADVYALSVHPDRPFTYVSTSRDTSIRFWTYNYKMEPLVYSTLLLGGQLDPDFISTVKAQMLPDSTLGLCGAGSKALLKRLQADAKELSALPTFLNFIMNIPGLQELWALAESVVNESKSENERIPHLSDLRSRCLERAKSLLNVSFDLGGGKPSERTQAAADIHLGLGNVKEYCNIMIELGQWERAISIAPSHSIGYWQDLSLKYAEHLRSKGDNNVVPYYVATGAVDNLMSFQASQNDLTGALLTAVSDAMDKIPRPQDEEEEQKEEENEGKREEVDATPRIQSTINRIALSHQSAGNPVLAASYHLANADPTACTKALVTGDCIDLAYAFVRAAKVDDADYVFQEMAKKNEMVGLFHNAFRAYSEMSGDPQRELNLLAARFVGGTREIDDFYIKCNCEPPSRYVELAAEAEEGSAEQFTNLVMGRQYHSAVEKGVALISAQIKDALDKGGALAWGDVKGLIDYLNSCCLDNFKPEMTAEVLAYSFFGAFQESMFKGYTDLVPFLVETIKSLVATHQLDFAVPFSFIKLQEATFFESIDTPYAAQCINECFADQATLPAKAKPAVVAVKKNIETVLTDVWNDPQKKAQAAADTVGSLHNPTQPVGGALPGGSSRKFPCVSYISRRPIRGARVCLADNETCVGHREAVLFASVTPFSPLADGSRFNSTRFQILPAEVILSQKENNDS
eukprot:CAMPEP_0175092440 /NCGR_PEP_ID=MMETSP0086_2-20121207/2465_1 /TAXON_ID=136419 /ORGANISM="Unknown Unknown, Strain D1" /LENGTH=1197 /DNA_ID=CAMNT_0016365305 /DNA_START=336 /DNA_END=3929 /DNA_ORIENTATION=-